MPTWLASTVAKDTATLNGDEVIRLVDDPSGTPVSAKTTVTALKNYISSAIDATYLTEAEASTTYQTKAFTQSGTGATARTVEAKLQEVLSVADYGSDLTAFTNAFARAAAADVTLHIPGGDYSLSGDLTPALGNLRVSISPEAEFNGAGTLKFDSLIPYQITPTFAREYIGGIYDSSWNGYFNVFQNASFAKSTTTDSVAIVAQFGEGEAAANGSEVWGGNFVGVASVAGGTALGVEINPVNLGGTTYGLVIASAGTAASQNAIQIQANEAVSTFVDGIKFNSAVEQVVSGSLIIAPDSTAGYGVNFSGSTFDTAAFTSTGFSVSPVGSVLGTSTAQTTAGLRALNTTDNANVTGLIVEGDRATPAADDNVHIAMKLSDSAGTQTEFGRISVYGTTVTDASEAGELRFGVISAGALANRLRLSAAAMVPNTNDGLTLGDATRQFADLYLASGGRIYHNNGAFDTWGTGTPEGAVTAPVGSTFRRTDGGAGTTFYVKESGSGNTGWAAK